MCCPCCLLVNFETETLVLPFGRNFDAEFRAHRVIHPGLKSFFDGIITCVRIREHFFVPFNVLVQVVAMHDEHVSFLLIIHCCEFVGVCCIPALVLLLSFVVVEHFVTHLQGKVGVCALDFEVIRNVRRSDLSL